MDRDDELSSALRRNAEYYAAPPGLGARIRAALARGDARQSGWRRLAWPAALALSSAAALLLGLALNLTRPGAGDALADELVASHVRSLMADHLADVASSDRHTVKPWFAGKLDFSPPVLDLTAQGFALVGGRLDYVRQRPVAALVYRHRQHLINLFIWPAAAGAAAAPRAITRRGYHLLHWTEGAMTYWAVSDLSADELLQLQAKLEAAPGSTVAKP